MSDVLEEILAAKRSRLAKGEYAAGAPAVRPSDGPAFVSSLREPGTRIVAEIKARSPSAGEIVPGADGKTISEGVPTGSRGRRASRV
jgi:indole-3-glycerol phosphate synthase